MPPPPVALSEYFITAIIVLNNTSTVLFFSFRTEAGPQSEYPESMRLHPNSRVPSCLSLSVSQFHTDIIFLLITFLAPADTFLMTSECMNVRHKPECWHSFGHSVKYLVTDRTEGPKSYVFLHHVPRVKGRLTGTGGEKPEARYMSCCS